METDTAGSVCLAEEEMAERFETTVVRRASSCAWLEALSVEQVETRLRSVACMVAR